MINAAVKDSHRLISAIINQAIFDAILVKSPKNPLPLKPKKYQRKRIPSNPDFVSSDHNYLAWDARNFLRSDNKLFCFYCEIIDIDPVYLAEKVHKQLERYDKSLLKIFDPI